ncbi:MAG: tetratricopeptide repeat protein [Firmicutes bacterium]|nr:tetratricopeptide repeat protein [Bacillota bacterium]
MSRTIRVKNKHLVVAALLLIFLTGLARASGGAYLLKMAERARENRDPVKALAYYDKFISEYPDDERIPDALYWSASLLPDNQSFRAVIFPSSMWTTRSHNVIDEIPEEALSKEERLLEIYTMYSDHWSAPHATHQLAVALYHSGDPRAEEYLLKAASEGRNMGNRIEAAFLLVDMYVAEGRFDDAEAMLDYCATEMPTARRKEQQLRRGDLLVAMGDYQGARAAYEKILEMFEDEDRLRQETYEQPGDPGSTSDKIASIRIPHSERVDARIAALNALEGADAGAGMGEIKGIVLLDGKPLPGARIIVREVKETTAFSTDYTGLPAFTVLDDGKFHFSLPAGCRYEVGIALGHRESKEVEGYHLQMVGAQFTLERGETREVALHFAEPVEILEPLTGFVYDGRPFTVRWNPYPGAHAYSLSFHSISYGEHGYNSMGMSSMRTADTVFEINSIPEVQFGAFASDDKGVLPIYLTGVAEAYSLRILALDEHGSVMSSSNGLYFGAGPNPKGLIEVEPRKLREEEKLLMDRKYDEAVLKLEEAIKRNTHDIRALEILSRIYFMGTYYTTQDESIHEMAHVDLERSRDILEALVALEPSREHLNALAVVCTNLDDREGAASAYKTMLECGFESSVNLNTLAYYALTVEDDYQQALAYAERAKGMAEEHYDPLPLTGLYVMTGQCSKAVDLLQNLKAQGPRGTSELEESLRRYTELNVGVSPTSERRNNYLGTVSHSFLEAQQIWQEDKSAHSSFLLLVARLSDPLRHYHREELRRRIDEFQALYGSDAPVLADVIEALAWASWL